MSDAERFVAHYTADAPRVGVDDAFHDELGGRLPRQLHDLYDELGLGKLRGGMFELVDPRALMPAYSEFFGGDAGGRVPFLVNAFGEPIAYKRIGPREAEISILHTYGPQIEVLAYTFSDFLDRVLLTDDGLRQVLNISLYDRVRGRLRKTRPGECYGFDPGVLREEPEGTKADASYFEVVETVEHMELLLRRADED